MKPESLTAVYIYIYIYIWTNLINKSTVGVAYYATLINHTTYLSITGLFAEKKLFLANSRVRDG